MNKLKILLKFILNNGYGASILCMAFNIGIGEDPDGRMFIPLGIAILVTILIIDFLIVIKTIKSNNLTKLEKAVIITIFVIVKIIGLMADQDGWRNIIHCLEVKFIK